MQPAEVDFKRNAAVLLATLSADKIVAFVTFVYFANYFSPGAFGSAYAVLAISGAALGFPRAVNVSVKKFVSTDVRRTTEIFLLGAVFAVLYAAVVGAVSLWAVGTFTIRNEQFVTAGIAHLLVRGYFHLVKTTYEGTGETGRSGILEMVDGVVTSALRFGMILGLGMGVSALLYGPIISAVVIGTVATVPLVRLRDSIPDRELISEFVRFSFWTVTARGVYMAFNNAQSAFPGFIVGSAATSFMKTAKNLAEPAAIVQSAVLKNTFVDVSSLDARGKKVTRSVKQSLKYADIIAFPIVGGALVIGNDIMITIYGQPYSGTGIILLATSAAFLFNIHVNVLTSTLHAVSRPQMVAFSNLLVSVIFLPVMISVLIVYDTVYAVLPVIVVARIFETGVLYYLVRREIGESVLIGADYIKKAVSTGVMIVGVAAAEKLVPISSFVTLGSVILAGAIIYATTLLSVDSESRQFVMRLAR